DLGFMIKTIIAENPAFEAGGSIKSALIFTMPMDETESENFDNAYYALTELDHYMSGNPYSIEDITSGGQKIEYVPGLEQDKKPFDFVYLVGNRAGASSTDTEINKLISEYIYSELFSAAGANTSAHRDNYTKYLREKDSSRLATCYSTFGLALIEYPVSQIAKLASVMYVKEALEDWTGRNDNPPHFIYTDIFLGDAPNDRPFMEQMKKECHIIMGDGNEHVIRLDGLLENIKKRAYADFEQDKYNVAKLERLIKQLEESFQKAPNIQIKNAVTPGIVVEIIERNALRLSAVWYDLIKRTVLAHMFGNIGGIELSNYVLDNIIRDLERMRIKTVPKTSAGTDAILEGIKSINKDWFFRPFRKGKIEQQMKEFKRLINRYINNRIENLVFEHTNSLLDETLGLVAGLKKKLLLYWENIKTLKSRLEIEIRDLSTQYPINGYVVRGDVIPIRAAKTSATMVAQRKYMAFIDDDFSKLNEYEWHSETEGFVPIKTDETIGLVRGNSITALNSQGVEKELEIELAQDVDNSKRGILGNVHNNLSKLTLDINDRDPIAVQLSEFRRRATDSEFKRIFYRGGERVTSNEAARTDTGWLTRELSRMPAIHAHEWGKVNQGLDSDNVIIFLRERGGFPLHFWNALKGRSWRNAIERANAADLTTAMRYLGRADENFLGFEPSDARRMKNAKLAFWLAVVSGAVQIKGEEKNEYFEIVVTGTRRMIAGSSASAFSPKIPVDYNNAARKLATDRTLLNNLTKAYDKKIDDMGLISFLGNIYALLVNKNFPETVSGIKDDNIKEERHRLLTRWIVEDDSRRNTWNKLYEDYNLGGGLTDLVNKIETVDESNGHYVMGYYCAQCNQYIGTLTMSLETIDKKMDDHFC
ncbi:MAG: tubulin-like doman-containing protein, partial [Defluviitaleaceae bacterium]|nr:tubulin-like doman-containing protein [Defluviitaleaceae bacterium]